MDVIPDVDNDRFKVMRVGTVERDVVVRSNNNDMRVKAEYTRLHYTAKTNEIADIRAAAVANNQHREPRWELRELQGTMTMNEPFEIRDFRTLMVRGANGVMQMVDGKRAEVANSGIPSENTRAIFGLDSIGYRVMNIRTDRFMVPYAVAQLFRPVRDDTAPDQQPRTESVEISVYRHIFYSNDRQLTPVLAKCDELTKRQLINGSTVVVRLSEQRNLFPQTSSFVMNGIPVPIPTNKVQLARRVVRHFFRSIQGN